MQTCAMQFNILKVFGIVLGVTILLSLYLAGTITRPVRRLAAAADTVRRGHGEAGTIPDFTHRRDEIGDLSEALRDMTESSGSGSRRTRVLPLMSPTKSKTH